MSGIVENNLSISVEEVSNVTIVHLDGRLDILSAESLQATMSMLVDENNKIRLIINCQKLSFISSAGLCLFMIYSKKIEKRGGRLIFSAFNGTNRKIFEITGYNKFFTVFPTIEEGIRYYNN